MVVEKVCFKCAIDPFLGRQIQRRGISAVCSLCSSKRKCISLSEIAQRIENILSDYICEGDFVFRSDGTQYQAGDSIDCWVGELFDCDNVEPIVVAVCRKLSTYSDDVSYSRLPFRPDSMGHQWGEFQEGIKHGNRFFNDSAKTFLDWLFKRLDSYSASSDGLPVISIMTPENANSIFRARACTSPETVNEIMNDPGRHLSTPPKGKAGEGRMNPAGVPAFYGAFERLTCIAELRPPVGGTVVSGEFRLTGEARLLDFRQLETANLGPVPSVFEAKYFAKTERREFLRYLHNEITLPVLPGMERNYLTTQVIAEYLATHCKPRIDGVIFKSVQNESGTNIVLFSHIACATESMRQPFGGGYVIGGGRNANAPRIEYVPASLQYHKIERVEYAPTFEPLRDETRSKAPTTKSAMPRPQALTGFDI